MRIDAESIARVEAHQRAADQAEVGANWKGRTTARFGPPAGPVAVAADLR